MQFELVTHFSQIFDGGGKPGLGGSAGNHFTHVRVTRQTDTGWAAVWSASARQTDKETAAAG